MSWDVDLCDPKTGERVEVESHEEGGTYVLGGTDEAELNVTYNYGGEFVKAWPEEDRGGSLRDMLNDRTGEETLPLLRRAVEVLGTKRDPDYWRPCPGNAGHALSVLASWAEQHPDAVWEVY